MNRLIVACFTLFVAAGFSLAHASEQSDVTDATISVAQPADLVCQEAAAPEADVAAKPECVACISDDDCPQYAICAFHWGCGHRICLYYM